MPQEAELLKAVLEKPDVDAPRLAYADWCASQPDPAIRAKATVIRNQLLANQSGDDYGGPATEARKLIQQFQTQWIGELARFVTEVDFHRGFVERVTIACRRWLESARNLRRLAPVRHLDLIDTGAGFAEAIQSDAMEGIRSLGLMKQGLMDADLKVLAQSPRLGSLRWLSLVENRITLEGAEGLAGSKMLPALHWVNFYGNPCQPNEKYAHDQGLVVDTWLPPDGVDLEARFGPLKWLHHPAQHLWDTVPDRFTMK